MKPFVEGLTKFDPVLKARDVVLLSEEGFISHKGSRSENRLDGVWRRLFMRGMDAGEPSQGAVYDREVQVHASDVLGWLHRRFPGLKDPESVLQEALLRVWRRMKKQNDHGSPRALLFTTARNLAIDELRRNKIIMMDDVAEMDKLSVAIDEPDAAETASINQELELLTLAIQSLPKRCRQVFTLRKIYSMSQKEIAAEMGISEHTVEVQVANGMRRCAAFLAKHDLP